MRLSTRSRYGVRAMLNLALHYKKGPISVRYISDKEDISVAYIEQLLAKLRKANLVDSVRGPNGGYKLAKKPGDITVFNIIKALEKDVEPVYCLSNENADKDKRCARINRCVARLVWKKLADSIHNTLDSISLDSMCRQAQSLKQEAGLGHKYTFSI